MDFSHDVENRTRYAEVLLKEDVDKFFNSDLGKYVLGCSKQEVDSLIDEFKKLSPYEYDKVVEIHKKINHAEGAITWLKQALNNGAMALSELEEEENA